LCECIPGGKNEIYVKDSSMHKYLLYAILLLYIESSNAQNVGIGTSTPLARLHITDNDVLFSAIGSVPGVATNPPVSGGGRRTMWYASKAAFRTGYVLNTNWDKDSIGKYSLAAGFDTRAKGDNSCALGRETAAEGTSALSAGYQTKATGINSFATGYQSIATGDNSIAAGRENVSSGIYSFAAGFNSSASGTSSFAFGNSIAASGQYAFATGNNTEAAGISSTSFGSNTQALANGSFAMGSGTEANGLNSFAGNQSTVANGSASASIGFNTICNGYASLVIGQYNDSVVTRQTSFSASNTPLLIVGNGTAENSRRNALLINSNGKIGIGTNTPETTVDIDGDISLKSYTLNIGGGGPYSNVITGNKSFLRIESNGIISISGFQGGYDGKILVVFNNTGNNMTFQNLNTLSDVANRINTLNGADITTTTNGVVTFIYSGAVNKWLVIAVRE
jgi:Head domain of trimeric autotransporter adhesin